MVNITAIRIGNRQTILNAAIAIIAENGVIELTLEGAAKRAGVTKGGVVYHFKTKEELIHNVVEQMTLAIEERIRATAAKCEQSLDSLLIAMINDMFESSTEEKQLVSKLLAAISIYPNQLAPVQQMYNRIFSDLTQNGNIGESLMIACALDGMYFLELLNIKHFSEEERNAMRKSLIDVARQISRNS